MTALLAPRPTDAWLAALQAAVRPEFQVEPYIPHRDDAILYGPSCRFEHCSAPARSEGQRMCPAHKTRWHNAGRPDLETWDAPLIQRDIEHRKCAVVACPASAVGRYCVAHTSAWHNNKMDPAKRDHWEATAPPGGLLSRSGGPCVAPGCTFPARCYARGTPPRFCDAHYSHFKQRRQLHGSTVEDHLVYLATNHLPKYWFSAYVPPDAVQPIGPVLRLELQYALQVRHDRRRAGWRSDLQQGLVTALAAAGVQSLFELQPLMDLSRDRLTQTGRAANQEFSRLFPNQNVKGYIRYAVEVLTTLRLSAEGLTEHDRDLWRMSEIGPWPEHEYEAAKHVDFRPIPAGWLRDLVKRWAKYLVAAGRKPSTINGQVRALHTFARFLDDEELVLASAADLDRELLLDYAAWVRQLTPKAGGVRSNNTLRREFGGLNKFLHDVRINGWEPDLAWNAAYFHGELNLHEAALPRFFEADVLAQMKDERNLSLLPTPGTRAMIEIVLDTGLRISDLRRLPIDCVYRDYDGNVYLRPFNWKMSREFAIPVSDRLAEVVDAQRARVHAQWPDCQWLFPRDRTNRDGEHPYTSGQFKQVLSAWCDAIDLRGSEGEKVRVTGHQFRHSVGTLLLNSGMSMEAVRAYLDHDSVATTVIYAQMQGSTLRREWTAAQEAIRVNVKGEIIPVPQGAQHETARWLRDELVTNRTSQAVAHGWCGLPVQQECPHANACFTCEKFESGPVFLGDIKSLFKRTKDVVRKAEENGQTRMAEMNERAAAGMENVISSIESALHSTRPDGDDDA